MLLTWLSTLASLGYSITKVTKRALTHAVSQDETGDGEGYGQEDA